MRAVFAVKIHNTEDVLWRFSVTQREGESLDAFYERQARGVERVERESLERFGESCVDIDPVN